MDPFLLKIRDRPLGGRFTLVKKIGAGGFGVVYLAKDLSFNREVALKLEHHSIDPSILEEEATKYNSFQGQAGIPCLYWFGWHDDFRVMAFELLGPSLADLFCYCERKLTLKTTLMILDQILKRLEMLHVKGLVHRDIKPRNFLLGTGCHGNDIYVTDFGLVEDYTVRCRSTIESDDSTRVQLIGTARFASIRGHLGTAQFPSDDLESLGYMMIYFLRGKLPWQGLDTKRGRVSRQEVMRLKLRTAPEELCAGLPKEFCQYMQLLKTLGPGEVPDYGKIRANFQGLATREGLQHDHMYDWTIRTCLELRSATPTL